MRQELGVTLFIAVILLIVSSGLMFYFENPVQPELFSSIPASMWWGVTALTTVGYGDVYPITIAGRCLGSVVAFLGIGFFALPAGIVLIMLEPSTFFPVGSGCKSPNMAATSPQGVGRSNLGQGTSIH